jgi:hypothetical protein
LTSLIGRTSSTRRAPNFLAAIHLAAATSCLN